VPSAGPCYRLIGPRKVRASLNHNPDAEDKTGAQWMALIDHAELLHLLAVYGYAVIAVMIALEGMCIPLPGETTLIAAAVFAGRTHELSFWGVLAAAIIGAVAGDNVGFWLGRSLGYRLLLRCGRYMGLTEARLKLGQYLFQRHGAKVAFFGRFVGLLRTLVPFVAGANRMDWRRFAPFNAAGGALWASVVGGAAFAFGRQMHEILSRMGVLLAVAAVLGVVAAIGFLRRNEARLTIEAERAFPGRLSEHARDAR
jgi:membrane protein DedA with SNARE-associated domain